VLEPINHRDIPGYFTNTTAQVEAIIKEVGATHLKLQLDLYHLQVTEGDLQKRTERLFRSPRTCRFAGNPDRNEPDIGEANHLTCSMSSTAWATRATWDWNTSPRPRPAPASAGRRKYGIKA